MKTNCDYKRLRIAVREGRIAATPGFSSSDLVFAEC